MRANHLPRTAQLTLEEGAARRIKKRSVDCRRDIRLYSGDYGSSIRRPKQALV